MSTAIAPTTIDDFAGNVAPATARWQATWPVEVRPVRTRHDQDEFIRFPAQVYRDDPHWVPPLEVETRAFIDPARHPFYQHGAAIPLLATSGGRTVGRILVSDDPNFNREHGTNLGCFGMFESIHDQHTADALFGAAADWLRARGRTEMLGPVDYSMNYPTGLLVDGFDSPPRVMMNHHPRYYAELLKNGGMEKAKDLYAWWFLNSDKIGDAWQQRVERMAERFRVTIRPIRMNDFDAEVQRIKQVYNEAWEKSWGFVKMTDAEFEHLAHQIKRMAVPEMILLAEVDDRPVGLSITLPDVNEAIKPLGGRLTRFGLPIGLARLAYNLPRVKTARMAVLGVVEGYRRRGIAEMLILQTFLHGTTALGYEAAELGWTLEDNDLVNRAIERVGGRKYKTYRTYRKEI